MQKKLTNVIIVFCLFLFLISFSFNALAQERKLEVDYPEILGTKPETTDIELTEYLKYIFNFIVIIAGLMLFGVLIYGGIKYLASADNPSVLMDAREQILAGFLGILILLSGYIILTTIDPQLTIIEVPKPWLPEPIERPDIDRPEVKILTSSIDAELPLGRIIAGRIFETYAVPGQTDEPRMARIKKNAEATSGIVDKLTDESEVLEELTHECECGYTECVYDCELAEDECVFPDENYCTCDPCPDRFLIEESQERNLQKIRSSKEFENLEDEQAKTIEEIKQIKFELQKLERLETYFAQDCRLWTLRSLSEFLIKADRFPEREFLREIKFWDDISTVYWDQKEKKWVRDWIVFYCQVGGTTFFEQPLQPALEDPAPDIPGIYLPETESCFMEAPIGEIIDRVKRTTKLLIDRLEQLNEFQGEMIGVVDELHVLISQCSSQNCPPVCIETREDIYDYDDEGNLRYDDEGNPIIIEENKLIGCNCVCAGTPCPYSEIKEKLKEIKDIREEIKKTVFSTKITKEEIGIIPIIGKTVPAILGDLETVIWYPMKECVRKEGNSGLFDTQRVLGAFDPDGVIIRIPCYKEPVYNECLDQCFLEQGHEKYRECLKGCLVKKAKEYDFEQIAWCRHLLNFYCCTVEWHYLE